MDFVGDVGLGRLIDRLLPPHVHKTSEATVIQKSK